MPTCHNYYPVKHGKNPADGVSGQVKLTFKRGKLSHEATIRNARELFEYTSEAMNKKVDFLVIHDSIILRQKFCSKGK